MRAISLRFKFLATLISAMLTMAIFVGGLSIYEVDRFVRSQTEDYINAFCEKEASQVNSIFHDMEQSVRIMESYVMDFVNSMEDVTDENSRNEIVFRTEEMFADVVRHNNDAIAYYLRFSPDFSDGKTGLFYSKLDGGDEYIRFEPTDLFLYDKNDIEHVGWFWLPYEAGCPVWLRPYYNQNNQVYMISFVVPMYFEEQFIGVIGMDFDFTILTSRVQKIKLYENSYAHLEVDGTIIEYDSPVSPEELSDPDSYLNVSSELINGMTLVLSASYDDIWQIRYEIAFKILLVMLALVAVFTVIAIWVVARMVSPLKKLTEASQKLADGNYDVEIVAGDTREIKLLSTAFENMTMHLREHKRLLHLMAYRDALTGLRNTTAYQSWMSDFNQEIQENSADFGVIVMDVNFLKETNDQHGHDVGNALIVTAAQMISGVFKRSPVFRIGGDEFVVILQKRDLEDYRELLVRFEAECKAASIPAEGESLSVSIATGYAKYDPSKDTQFMDVFHRADEAMYENKRSMKTTGQRKA